jgi:hypothetical protein
MKIKLVLMLGLLMTVAIGKAQVPGILRYQGQLTSKGTNFNGTARLKFALVDGVSGVSHWSNDGTSVNGSEPTAYVGAKTINGVVSILLGDTSIENMTAIPYEVFGHPDVRIRVWVSTGEPAFTLLAPDNRMAASGYAMYAAALPDKAITSDMLAIGAVSGPQIAKGSVTPDKIPDGSITGTKIQDHSITSDQLNSSLALHELALVNNTGLHRIELSGSGLSGTMSMSHGTIGKFMDLSGSTSGGLFKLYDKLGGEFTGQTTVELGSSSLGGYARVYQDNGNAGVHLNGQNGANPGGSILVYREDGKLGINMLGQNVNGAGSISVRNALGDLTVDIVGAENNNPGGQVAIYQEKDKPGIVLDGRYGSTGGLIQIYRSDGTVAITLDAQNGAGESQVTTQVLKITGGADLSEQFDVTGDRVEPGMIVCIDPENPGKLVRSSGAYDSRVAGVISGAGGIKTGMLMGQTGSVANGQQPVALSGRVYCLVDAAYGAIQPGDFITTSDTPGYGMKATDPLNGHGTIIGKAMTAQVEGKGLALVLINLQ